MPGLWREISNVPPFQAPPPSSSPLGSKKPFPCPLEHMEGLSLALHGHQRPFLLRKLGWGGRLRDGIPSSLPRRALC